MPKKLTTEEFIEKAKAIHGDKYDYSKVNYINNHTKVEIICPKHGSFWQKPCHHINRGDGCPECRKNKKLTKGEFITRAIKIHNNKYDYSKVDYKNNSTKVCIICPEHGEFWQNPNNHIRGAGCPKCSSSYCDVNKFVEKAKQIHGNDFDYNLVNYKNAFFKVELVCNKCGNHFLVAPNNHLNGTKCPCCSWHIKSNTDNFIIQAKQIHGNKYDYSKVDYKTNDEKVCIVCPKHGEFWQTPHNHLHGQGCPCCYSSRGETKIKNFLERNSITKFVYQYRCEWLGKQSIDFFFPEQKFGIEFDGEQHYRPVNWKGALTEEQILERYNKVIRRDKRKDEKCVANGIKLFRIRYDEDIEKALTKILKLYNIEIKEECDV